MMPYNAPTAPTGKDALNAKLYGGEIDIMEAPAYARKSNGIVQQALHIGDYNRNTGTSTFSMNWLTENVGDIYDSFHTYGLYWDENMYKFYVDENVFGLLVITILVMFLVLHNIYSYLLKLAEEMALLVKTLGKQFCQKTSNL